MKTIVIMLVSLLIASAAVSAGAVLIDFESFNEKDTVSTYPTMYGPVNFYMTSSTPLTSLNVGDSAALAPTGDLPMVAQPDTKNIGTPPDLTNIVGFTVNDGVDPIRDDYILDNQGTGAGGKTLTDTMDTSQTPLLQHAYSKMQAIVIDVSSISGVTDLNLVGIDLDWNERWYFLYFDMNNALIHKTTFGPPVDQSGDGEAFPITYSDPRIAKVAVFGSMNLGQYARIGFAIDDVEIVVTEEEPTGDLRTIGFWKHQFEVAIKGKGKAQVDSDTLAGFLPLYGISNLMEGYNLLWSKSRMMETRAAQQCFASWLNYANNAVAMSTLVDTNYDKVPDTQFSAAMDMADNYISQGLYEQAKDICDSINNMAEADDSEDEESSAATLLTAAAVAMQGTETADWLGLISFVSVATLATVAVLLAKKMPAKKKASRKKASKKKR